MRKRLVALIVSLLFTAACPEPRRAGEGAPPPTEGGDGGTIRIVFLLPGDDIGAPEHVALLEEVRMLIEASGRGEVVRSEFGQGRMELFVKPAGADSLKTFSELIRAKHPSARFSVEQGAR